MFLIEHIRKQIVCLSNILIIIIQSREIMVDVIINQ